MAEKNFLREKFVTLCQNGRREQSIDLGLTESQKIDLFLFIARMDIKSPKKKQKEHAISLRGTFYKYVMTDIPKALQNYHLEHLKILRRNILTLKNPELILDIIHGMRDWPHVVPADRRLLAAPVLPLIADAYQILPPALLPTEPRPGLLASCMEFNNPASHGTMAFSTTEERAGTKQDTPGIFLEQITHEMGHMVERNLSLRVSPDIMKSLSSDLKKYYPPLRQESALGRAALMLALNSNTLHTNGYYFTSWKNMAVYFAQPKEKTSMWLEKIAKDYLERPLQYLKNAYELAALDNPLTSHDQNLLKVGKFLHDFERKSGQIYGFNRYKPRFEASQQVLEVKEFV